MLTKDNCRRLLIKRQMLIWFYLLHKNYFGVRLLFLKNDLKDVKRHPFVGLFQRAVQNIKYCRHFLKIGIGDKYWF
jgi:hypothetical protein